MNNDKFVLIGIDGGASKVSAWILDVSEKQGKYNLSHNNSTINYSSIEGYNPAFSPVSVAEQIAQRDQNEIKITEEERTQGNTYIQSVVQAILELKVSVNNLPVLLGIGMPGLKTADLRGINVIANGPRMISYCDQIEQELANRNIALAAPIARLGSDADYCGIGELYASDGSFQNTKNAYYLGGGTGAADALILNGKLLAFDRIKSWMAKTWELKNSHNHSLERFASASGFQYIYSLHSNIPTAQLNEKNIYPAEIASRAIHGEEAALKTFNEITENLALLMYDRITTIYAGTQNLFEFVNPNRTPLYSDHEYKNMVFDKIVIGQRLGELMQSEEGTTVLTVPFSKYLQRLIKESDVLDAEAKSHYCDDSALKQDKLVFSKLREAPALGAGIDAHLSFLHDSDNQS
jgi:predicted NBD/HSP70 family sugar kinase